MSINLVKSTVCPSQDEWIREAKSDPSAENIGMYLTHTGIVRKTAKSMVRSGEEGTKPVTGMHFSYDEAKVEKAISGALAMPGIYYIQGCFFDLSVNRETSLPSMKSLRSVSLFL